MNAFKISAAAAFIAALSAGSALAEPPTGYYVGGGAGITHTMDSDIDGTGINTEADFDIGPAGVLAFGHRYDSNYRGEIELGYRANDLDGLSGATTSVSGDVNALTVMANILYDYNYAKNFRPYFGIGAGMARIDIDGATPVSTTSVNDSDTTFAMQGIVGMAYDLTSNLELFGDYRYLHAFGPEFSAANNVKVDADYDNHTFLVGLRYSFGTVAAPAPVAEPVMQKPEPKAPRSFLVFFDWDSATISPTAQAILDQAAAYAKAGTPVKIELTGHADRSGTQVYNTGLSKRRAEAVKTTLMAQGILGNDVGLDWKGESEPLVATDDGVREPQNRRVQLVIE